jgi:hypothetical protein
MDWIDEKAKAVAWKRMVSGKSEKVHGLYAAGWDDCSDHCHMKYEVEIAQLREENNKLWEENSRLRLVQLQSV